MARRKRYTDQNVLEAAKDRLRHIYDTYDSVTVCFSGGKDSLAALELCREICEEQGRLPVHALFRDEELIPDEIVAFVDHYRRQSWLELLWFCVPLRSSQFLLGRTIEYVQWDRTRAHVRDMPEWATKLQPHDKRTFDQYTMDKYAASFYPGKVAFVTGMRASESLLRWRAAVSALNNPCIHSSNDKRVSLCWPIYDWNEDDVFLYFHERGIAYCPVYDAQMWSGQKMRVSTPFCAASAKFLPLLRASNPEFYARIMEAFPEMRLQERYWHDLDRGAIRAQYGQSWEGLRQYIEDYIPCGPMQDKVYTFLEKIEACRVKRPGAYPLAYVFDWLATGGCKRALSPRPEEKTFVS